MTTPFAEAVYLADHLAQWAGKGYAIFNPEDKPIEALPVIYGFNNGGPSGFMTAVLIAEDGECMGGHCCSSEGYMPHDLGILSGARPDRHEQFREKYPGGYRMDFVPYDKVDGHAALNLAFAKHEEREKEQADKAGQP